MAGDLAERLGQLEQSVRRAAELIARVKAERSQAEGEKAELQKRIASQAGELDELRARLGALEENQRELARLIEERKAILAQVEGILKELDALELP
ncbi:MAG: hypothetical protein HY726_21430 [Candidatus Rokubacteria bacterium]|nr:hypothetical protein [Candidatus Rokubacteria bacterium]